MAILGRDTTWDWDTMPCSFQLIPTDPSAARATDNPIQYIMFQNLYIIQRLPGTKFTICMDFLDLLIPIQKINIIFCTQPIKNRQPQQLIHSDNAKCISIIYHK